MTAPLIVVLALAVGQAGPIPNPVAPTPATLGMPSALPASLPASSTVGPLTTYPTTAIPNAGPGINTYGLPAGQHVFPLANSQGLILPYDTRGANVATTTFTTSTMSDCCNAWQGDGGCGCCCFLQSLCKSYLTEFGLIKEDKDKKNGDSDKKNGEPEAKNGDKAPEPDKPARRALPEPWSSPPFPGHEYQGYPLVGVPPSTDVYPLMKAVYDCCPYGEEIKDSRVKLYGWATASGNWSNANNSNAPTSYWVVPNRYELDQLVVRLEREPDMVQTDHIDWGFRSTGIYGQDYRYTTAGGWFSNQLLKENRLYGFDPIEQYFDVYIPWVFQGMVIRVGRWVACPDIETQLAPDNYLGSHSILFTFDTYTQTGAMFTFCLNEQWMVQGAIQSGTDMAPWYVGATPTGFFGVRWVALDNNDALYTCLNNINNAEFRHFEVDGQPAGHDNYNYLVSTWEHRFNEKFHTKTEAYFMWQRDAEVGGTPSIGPVQSFGGGGGDGVLLPGTSLAYGVLNYTELAITDKDYITYRSEWYRDERGMRTGFANNYSSFTLGLSHNFNSVFQIRPEIGWYHAYNQPAFDNGTKKDLVLYGFDMTLRF